MRIGKEVLILNLDDVIPNRFQPRITFDEKAIMELTESIKEHGVIQPIVVRRVADKFEIIAGERRYKASVLAGKSTIPAILADLNDRDSAEVALIENVQRQDLTPIEEAVSYKKILDMGYLNQVDLANKLGKTQSTVANKLRLLNLCDEVQEALLKEKISERHARSLLRLTKEQQKYMVSKIINERLTVRKTDEEVEKILSGQALIPEQESKEIKGENEMNNDYNNDNEVKPVETTQSPIFPSFTTTNIVESQPIDFNNSQNIENTQPNNVEPTIPIINTTNIEDRINDPMNNDAQANIFGAPINEENQNIKINNQVQEQPKFSKFFGSFGEQEQVQPIDFNNIQPITNVESVQQQSNDNNSFGNAFNFNPINNMDNMQQSVMQEIEPAVEPPQPIMPEVQPIVEPQQPIMPEVQPIVEPPQPIMPEVQPIMPEVQPISEIAPVTVAPIEELNFDSEIQPIDSYQLNDNQEFNNNSQIFAPNPSPVAIITPKEIPELQPIMPDEAPAKIGTINDMISKVRDVIDSIEINGYKVDSDEMDLSDSYQITITIEK